jgi:protein gp37
MGKNTKISWANHTFNPWIGCTKVSPGCTHCYAEVDPATTRSAVRWGLGQPRLRTTPGNWNKPMSWDGAARKAGEFHRVFCASLSDWLDDEVPAQWLADLLVLIHKTPNLHWLLLTKRPENWKARMQAVFDLNPASVAGTVCAYWLAGHAPQNVWVGTTVEDQKRCNERIPLLLSIPARIRFLSMEPLLESVNLWQATRPDGAYTCDFSAKNTALGDLSWVIVGGESGTEARGFNLDWATAIVRACAEAEVPCFVKQLGAVPMAGSKAGVEKLSLSDRKGGDVAEWPAALVVREFPL